MLDRSWEEPAILEALKHDADPREYIRVIELAMAQGQDPEQYLQRLITHKQNNLADSYLYKNEHVNFDHDRNFRFSGITVQSYMNGCFVLSIQHDNFLAANYTREKLFLPLRDEYLSNRINVVLFQYADYQDVDITCTEVESFLDLINIKSEQKILYLERNKLDKEYFKILHAIFPGDLINEYANEYIQFIAAFQQHFDDFDMGFPGGNIYNRELEYPANKTNMSSAYFITDDELELYRAAMRFDDEKVLYLLKRGVNPNAPIRPDYTIFESALKKVMILESRHSPLKSANTLKYLLEHGAKTDNKKMLDDCSGTLKAKVKDGITWQEMAMYMAFDHYACPQDYIAKVEKSMAKGRDPFKSLQNLSNERIRFLQTSDVYKSDIIKFDDGTGVCFSTISVKSYMDNWLVVGILHKTLYDADATRDKLKLKIKNNYRLEDIRIAFKCAAHPDNKLYNKWLMDLGAKGIDPEYLIINSDKESMENDFFVMLHRLFPDEVINEYADVFIKLATALQHYLKDYETGFPGENLFIREKVPVFEKEPYIDKYPTAEELDLYHAASHAESNKVLGLLKRGVNPNARVSLDLSILGGAIVRAVYLDLNPDEIIKTVKHLIRYEADINIEELNHRRLNVEQQAIMWSHVSDNKYQRLFAEIIRLIKASKTAKSIITVPPYHQHSLIGSHVYYGNMELTKRAKSSKPIKLGMSIKKEASYFKIRFKTPNGRTIHVESKSPQQITPCEWKGLFKIFVNNFPITLNFTLKMLNEIFRKMFIVQRGKKIIDIIRLDGIILGFNVATIFKGTINKKPVMIHHVDLAITSGDLRLFKRFMTLISNQRGYALQRAYTERQVISTCNAISMQSLIQSNGVNHYPKLDMLKEEIPQIINIIDPDSEIKITEYAIYKKAILKSPIDQVYKRKKKFKEVSDLKDELFRNAYFERQSDLEHEFISSLQKPQGDYGFFVALLCDQQNFAKHCELIAPDLGDLFKLTVDAMTDFYIKERWVTEYVNMPKRLTDFFTQDTNNSQDDEKKIKMQFRSKL